MSNVVSKLTALGYRPENGCGPAPGAALELLEQLGLPLPEDYREFLAAFPQTGSFDRRIAFSGIEKSPWASEGLETLQVLYARCSNKLSDLLAVRRQYAAEQIPAHFLAIGLVSSVNQVCLDLRPESLGRIYVWDHEHLDDERAGFYLTTGSFSAFIDLLHEVKPVPRTDGPKVEKVEMTEEFKARMAELVRKRKSQ